MLTPLLLLGQIKISNNFSSSIGEISNSVESTKSRKEKWFRDESCYLLSNNNEVIDVQYIDDEIKLRISNATTLKLKSENFYTDFPKKFTPIKVLSFANKYFYVYTDYEKKDKLNTLYFREIDMNKGVFKAPKVIDQNAHFSESYYMKQLDDLWEISIKGIIFSESQDGSKLLVEVDYGLDSDKAKKTYSGFKFFIFDTEMNVVQEKYTRIYRENNSYISRLLKNDGTIVLLSLNTEKDHFIIYSMSEDSEEFESQVLESETAISFTGFNIQERENSSITGTCIYMESGKAQGVYVVDIDKEFEVEQEYKFPYSEEIITQNAEEEKKEPFQIKLREDVIGIEFLVYRGMHIEDDGSFYVYGEIFHSDYVSAVEEHAYRFKNIVVSKFNKEFEHLWTHNITKSQRSRWYYGRDSSFKIFFEDENVYFVFIDNDKNLDREKDKLPVEHLDGKAGLITLVKIDYEGALTKYAVFEMKNDLEGDFSYYQRKKVHFNKNDLEFYIELVKDNKKDALLKVKLN